MTKPPPELAELIWRWPRTDKARPADLLHVTILTFGDLSTLPAHFLERLLEAMADFEGDAFRLMFDEVVESQHVLLCGSEPLRGAVRFQATLEYFLRIHGIRLPRPPPTPHLTIRYRPDGGGSSSIAPISWTATKLLLVESLVGHRRHIEHGRWQLGAGQRRASV